VKAVCSSINNAHETYRNIQKGAIEHKLSKINLAKEELDLKQRQISFCESSSKRLIDLFELSPEQEALIDQRTDGNPVMKLKILLSVFRRVAPLADKQVEGKLKVRDKKQSN